MNNTNRAEFSENGLNIVRYEKDDDLIDSARITREPRFRIYIPDSVSVVLGRGSRADNELNIDMCLMDAIPVSRRAGGGCAVVMDPGNIVAAAALPAAGIGGNSGYFDRLSQWLMRGLGECGIPKVVKRGSSDLAIGERKKPAPALSGRKAYFSTGLPSWWSPGLI